MTAPGGEPGDVDVLYVDPDEKQAPAVVDELDRAGLTVERVGDAEGARSRLAERPPRCVVSVQALPDGTGLDLLGTVRERTDGLPFVLFTDAGDERLASEAISAGVSDYVPREPREKQRGALVDSVREVLAAGRTEFPAVSEQLKDRAMDEAPVGITIADASRRDTPLIYVNEAFEELTGYPAGQTLGRNCNFLQGDDSNEEAVASMAAAIERDEPVSVELVNYTKAGEPFWNRVDIAPVREDGEVTHYVGFQLDVTDRVEAEREAKRQAEKATREREKVEALLERVDGLVTDVTGRLLGAGTRTDVERAVCQRLVETDAYAVAWIGERDPATDAVVPGTWAGVEAAPDIAVDGDGDDPVARALRTGERQLVTDSDAIPDHHRTIVNGPIGGLGAVPLEYGDVGYGVLVVYLREGVEPSEPELTVLSAVGQSAAMALHALTNQRLLTSDEVSELEFSLSGSEPVFVGLSAELDCSFTHTGTVTREDEATTFFVETDAGPPAVEAALADRDAAVSCSTVTEGDERAVMEFTLAESPLIRALLERGGRITAMSAESGAGELTVEIPTDVNPRTVVEAIEERLPGADLTAYRERERPAETRQDVRATLDERLTDRQRTALQTALVGGFFEWPRDSDGEDLAASMGIGRSTFHQHLRAAQRKVFEELYG